MASIIMHLAIGKALLDGNHAFSPFELAWDKK